MKRRTVILAIEIEGAEPDAMALRSDLRGRLGGRGTQVVNVEILDDGIGPDDEVNRRQARLTGQRP